MAYIVEKHEEQMIDAICSPDAWVARNPAYKGFFDSNQELRMQHQEQGTTLATPEWKHVASFMSPVMDVNKIINADFMSNKARFYAWLDRNIQYCTYDRRTGRRQ